ncbi:MAG: serine/threonine protein kinase [Pirellulales bacterium]|nr:serine/threonine protein kinase [Pirellulales bacterium]
MRFAYPSGSRPLDGYSIKRGVGRGGFGEVYYATSDAGKEVALKLIRRNLDVELRGVMHCLNLKHQNLIGLFDVRQDDNEDAWVVMEYVRGESLADVVDRNPQGMPVEQVLHWMRGIGAGVSYLHDQGIVHRDLKPGNIFDDDGTVKIGDYGLSKFISASRRSGQTESVGTVHYMAPEVAKGRYGKEVDVYALGIILYEMLTGRVPFEGESVAEVLMKHLTAEPDLSGISEPYRSVIAKALTKDEERRYRTVQELLADLPNNASTSSPPPPRSRTAPVPPATGAATAAPMLEAVAEGEPIWRAIGNGAAQIRNAWNEANIPQPLRAILIIIGVIALVYTSGLWIPAMVFFAIFYGIYYVIRAMFVGSPQPTSGNAGGPSMRGPPKPKVANAGPPPVDGKAPSRAVPVAHRTPRCSIRGERSLAALPIKAPRERFSELLGSMLLSAAVAATVAVVMTMVFDANAGIEHLAWLLMLSVAGAWGVLIPSKFWEGTKGEPILRRFVLLCVGLGLGGFSWLMYSLLHVELHPNRELVWNVGTEWHGFLRVEALKLHLMYFAFLLPVLRWWKLADPLRGTRFSLWASGVAILWAWMLSGIFQFPPPWGLMVAASVAVSVQLSAPWMDPHSRTAPRVTENLAV